MVMVSPLSCRNRRPGRNREPHLSSRKGATMNSDTTAPVCSQSGRKGIAYDWQSLYVAAATATLDDDLAALAPEYAE